MGNNPLYSSSVWRRTRLAVFERDNFLCQIRGPQCTLTAEHCDHIVPLRLGGHPLDPRNLRASCAKCNLTRPDPRLGLSEGAPSGPSREW